jgi:hypothetical protein
MSECLEKFIKLVYFCKFYHEQGIFDCGGIECINYVIIASVVTSLLEKVIKFVLNIWMFVKRYYIGLFF